MSTHYYDETSGRFCRRPAFSGQDLSTMYTYSTGRLPVAIGGGYITPLDPDTIWDKLALKVQGTFFDPARRMSVPDSPPAGSGIEPARWAGYVDGVTYAGTRAGVTFGLAGLAVGALATWLVCKKVYG